jgi:hypothetical protein
VRYFNVNVRFGNQTHRNPPPPVRRHRHLGWPTRAHAPGSARPPRPGPVGRGGVVRPAPRRCRATPARRALARALCRTARPPRRALECRHNARPTPGQAAPRARRPEASRLAPATRLRLAGPSPPPRAPRRNADPGPHAAPGLPRLPARRPPGRPPPASPVAPARPAHPGRTAAPAQAPRAPISPRAASRRRCTPVESAG